MANLLHLREEHAELVRLVGQLQAMIDLPAAPPAIELFGIRSRLNGLLIAHLKAEDWVLYPPLLDSPDPEVARTARRFVDEMGGLAAAYAAFNNQWDALRIGNDWPTYQRDAQGIIDALSDRIVRENRELYPLLERAQAA